jgi:biopolymer transport protein ExbB
MNLLEIVVRGGWLMIPIALCSVVVIALGVGRWLVIRRQVGELERFLAVWRSSGTIDRERFARECEQGPAAVALMAGEFKSGSPSRQEAAEAVETQARGNLYELEKGMGTMATMAAVAPLLGFLGTVTGMVRAFMQIQNLGGNVNASVLAGGIWEALITTVGGLTVGIPALLIHNYLAGMIRQAARQLEQCGDLIVRHLGSSQ